MNLAAIQARFKNFGKLIFVSQLAPTDSTALKKAAMGAVDQATSGEAADFDTFQQVMKPAVDSINGVVASVDRLPAQMKASVQSYLQKVLAVDLGLASGASVASVGAALVAEMTAASAFVTPSGTNGSNADGFAMYFADNFDIELPQDPSTNIPDAWIDDDVIA